MSDNPKKENYLRYLDKIINGTYGTEFYRDKDGKLQKYEWKK